MNKYKKKEKSSKASILLSVGVALIALAAEFIPEGLEVLKQLGGNLSSADTGERVEVRVQAIPKKILQATEGMKYCKVTVNRNNPLLYPREAEALYLTFYDEEEGFFQPVREKEAAQVPEESGAEYMFWRAAQEFLPPGMEYEMEYFIEVPEDTKVLYCTFYTPEEQEIEVEIEE